MSQLTSHNHKIWWKINIQNHLSLQAPGPLASRYSSAMLCIAFFILDRLRGALSPAVSLVSSCRTIIFTIIYRIREHFHWIFRHFSTVLMTDPDLTSVKIASFQGGISCRRPSWRSQLWAVHREGFNSLRCIKLFNLSTCCWGYLATFENDSRKSPSLPRRSAPVAASKPMLPVYPDLFDSFTLVRNPGEIVLPSTHAVAHAPPKDSKTQRPTYLNFQLSSLLQTSCKKHSPAAKMCWQQTGAQFIATMRDVANCVTSPALHWMELCSRRVFPPTADLQKLLEEVDSTNVYGKVLQAHWSACIENAKCNHHKRIDPTHCRPF